MHTKGPDRPPLFHGVRGVIYVLVGCSFVGLGVLGAFLPVLPTTPFLLLASYFFVRSSPRLNRRLLHSPLFGPFLRDWQKHRGVRLRVKVTAVCVLLAAVSASILWGNLPGYVVGVLLLLAAIGLTVVLRLPVIRDRENVGPCAPLSCDSAESVCAGGTERRTAESATSPPTS